MFSRRKCLNTSRNIGREDITSKILETKRYFSKNKYYVAFRKFTAIQMLQLYTRKNRFEFCQLSS